MTHRYTCSRNQHSQGFCQECFEKQLRIDRLEERVKHLESQLKLRTKKASQPFFGSSTPSSKVFLKKNTASENRSKQGGAKPGHPGNAGRHLFSREEADALVDLPLDQKVCTNCGGSLVHRQTDERCVIDAEIMEVKKVLYDCEVKRCQQCRCETSHRPLVLPRSKYGNGLISNSMVMHFLEGIPLGKIERIWGKDLVTGNLTKIFHKLANQLEPVAHRLLEELRQAAVFHADETGWRTDGHSGYCWLFCSEDTSVFRFEDTRSSRIVTESLSTTPLPGVLVVDRYAGYNQAPCRIQYCYEHLKRKLQDLGNEFPKDTEVQAFVASLLPKLKNAMKLRRKVNRDEVYYREAKILQRSILQDVHAPSIHLGIQSFQDIFRENEERLYHWVTDRRVPAENNRAERELRPTVIARKVSFGSQSSQGAKTRSIMMTVLHTVAKRLENKSIRQWIVELLQIISANPKADLYALIPRAP